MYSLVTGHYAASCQAGWCLNMRNEYRVAFQISIEASADHAAVGTRVMCVLLLGTGYVLDRLLGSDGRRR